MLWLRAKTFLQKKKDVIGRHAAKHEGTELTLLHWQDPWIREDRGRWTEMLISNLKAWVDRQHDKVNYHLTQFLSGHGNFHAYIYRMGKVQSTACQYSESPDEDALHTFFYVLQIHKMDGTCLLYTSRCV